MKKLRDYYHESFRKDIATLLHGINPPEARVVTLGHDWVGNCSLLARITADHRPQFLSCLHFTVLADQAMDYHFSFIYPEFERLTMYPKFRVGLGHPAFLNPIRILTDPIRCNHVAEREIRGLIPESMQLFVAETENFINLYIKKITPVTFFDRLLADPDIAAGWEADRTIDSENLTLKRFCAREFGQAVSQMLNRRS